MAKIHFHQYEDVQDTVYDSVYQSDNSYYEFLSDMRFDEHDGCDYCAAFMFI